jgi:hypothetical protein
MRYTFPAHSDARLMTAILTRLARPVTAVEGWKGQIAVFFGRRHIRGIPTGGMSADQRATVLTILRSRGTVIPGS